MKQRLHRTNVLAAMSRAGLSQAGIASKLKVSREAVSQWVAGKSTPRPDKLLQLGKLLGLSFSDLVHLEDEHTPIVAFRKYRGTKISGEDLQEARTMGRLLRNLVPHLPFDIEVMPPRLKSPSLAYDYVQQAAERVRKAIKVEPEAHVDVHHLVRYFADLQAVLIPVLWGNERGSDRHANAAHIYLPDSGTTWVYLNLDTHFLDFKFWMAHELGHCLAPGEGEERETFADAFAGALLFSHAQAEAFYRKIARKPFLRQLALVHNECIKQGIAPYTISKQLEAYAKHSGQEKVDLGAAIHKMAATLNKDLPMMSAHLLGADHDADVSSYIKVSEKIFETPFFNALGAYLRSSKQGAGFVQSVMDVPLLDARGIFDRLT